MFITTSQISEPPKRISSLIAEAPLRCHRSPHANARGDHWEREFLQADSTDDCGLYFSLLRPGTVRLYPADYKNAILLGQRPGSHEPRPLSFNASRLVIIPNEARAPLGDRPFFKAV
jgi:hypothetical protein